jgi:hypothetical protein
VKHLSTKQDIKARVKKFIALIREKYKVTGAGWRKVLTDNCQFPENEEYYHYFLRPKLKRIVKECGFEFGGSGGSRFVLLYKNFAIKIDKYDYDEAAENRIRRHKNLKLIDRSANEDEVMAYKTITDENPVMKLCMIPIIHKFRLEGRLFLVYPRLEIYEDKDVNLTVVFDDPYNQKKEELINSYFLDTGETNMGLYKNEMFFLDYNIENSDIECPDEFNTAREIYLLLKDRICKTRRYIKEMEDSIRA